MFALDAAALYGNNRARSRGSLRELRSLDSLYVASGCIVSKRVEATCVQTAAAIDTSWRRKFCWCCFSLDAIARPESRLFLSARSLVRRLMLRQKRSLKMREPRRWCRGGRQNAKKSATLACFQSFAHSAIVFLSSFEQSIAMNTTLAALLAIAVAVQLALVATVGAAADENSTDTTIVAATTAVAAGGRRAPHARARNQSATRAVCRRQSAAHRSRRGRRKRHKRESWRRAKKRPSNARRSASKRQRERRRRLCGRESE